MQLNGFLERSASRLPGKTALVCGEKRYTYLELDQWANALAHYFKAAGLKRHERVCVNFDNSMETVAGVFGALKADGVFLVVNPQVKGDKLAYIVNDCQVRILVTGVRNLNAIHGELANCPSLTSIVLADLEQGEDKPAISPAARAYLDAKGIRLESYAGIAKSQPKDKPKSVNIDVDLASLIYTSGSTGNPKGVTLTHLNMVVAATSITTYLENREDDIVLSCLPLAFDYGLYQALMVIKFGGTLILERQFLYPYKVIELIKKEKVTGFPFVPTIVAILLNLKDLEDHDFSSLRYVTNTAQALPPHHIARIRKIMPHVRVYSMYGLTECKRVSYLPPEKLDAKPTSVGIAMPNTEVWV
jgi:long-chain acyl-CoA synthetase